MKKPNLASLLSAPFVLSLGLLLLNDFVLKYQFPGWFTGKLSDFAGLLAFAMFWEVVFPQQKRWMYLLSGVCFIWWKTPASQGFIDIFSQYGPFAIDRVVDYTDFIAVLILPIGFWYQKKGYVLPVSQIYLRQISGYALAGIALFAFCATSMPLRFRHQVKEGKLFMFDSYEVKMSEAKIQKKWTEMGLRFQKDSTTNYASVSYESTHYSLYQVNYKGDTLSKIGLQLDEYEPNESFIFLRYVELPDGMDEELPWDDIQELLKEYRKLVRKGMVKRLKRR